MSFSFLDGSFCPNGRQKQYVTISAINSNKQTYICGAMNSEATHVCVSLTTASSIKLPSNLPYITIIMICFLMTDAGGRTCTCGVKQVSNAPTDIGHAGNWPFFPILSFNIGDTGNTGEYVQYVLGPLVCKQGD